MLAFARAISTRSFNESRAADVPEGSEPQKVAADRPRARRARVPHGAAGTKRRSMPIARFRLTQAQAVEPPAAGLVASRTSDRGMGTGSTAATATTAARRLPEIRVLPPPNAANRDRPASLRNLL